MDVSPLLLLIVSLHLNLTDKHSKGKKLLCTGWTLSTVNSDLHTICIEDKCCQCENGIGNSSDDMGGWENDYQESSHITFFKTAVLKLLSEDCSPSGTKRTDLLCNLSHALHVIFRYLLRHHTAHC